MRGWLIVVMLAGSTLGAQDKPEAKVDVPALLREVEFLKRENTALKRDLRIRDTHIQLATREREFILSELGTDKTAAEAAKGRCGELERQLRALETPKPGATFDCEALTFKAP